jgi:hypothetical protein
MKYDMSHLGPKEKVIKQIALDETTVQLKVETVRKLAALLTGFPTYLRSSLLYEYTFHLVVHTLSKSATNFLPSWLYMEHAAAWVQQALSTPLPEREHSCEDTDLLFRIAYHHEQTTPEREYREMARLYQRLSLLDENYRWVTIVGYIQNKYQQEHGLNRALEIHDAVEILAFFQEWLKREEA